jgi:hypothetical protein
MTIYAVYETESGRLVSTTDDPGKVAAPEVLAGRDYRVAERPDTERNGIWNPATLSFAPLPAETRLSKVDFLKRFTAPERIAIRGITDPMVVDFLHLLDLAEYVDLADLETQTGVRYVAATYPDALTPDRASEILA